MSYDEIVSVIAQELNLPKQFVNRTYKSYWRAVREYVGALPLKEDLSDEEFMKLRPNVNVPSIGKLYITLDRYKNIKKSYELNFKSRKGNKQKQDNNVED